MKGFSIYLTISNKNYVLLYPIIVCRSSSVLLTSCLFVLSAEVGSLHIPPLALCVACLDRVYRVYSLLHALCSVMHSPRNYWSLPQAAAADFPAHTAGVNALQLFITWSTHMKNQYFCCFDMVWVTVFSITETIHQGCLFKVLSFKLCKVLLLITAHSTKSADWCGATLLLLNSWHPRHY
jgi:hypothetical protein